MQWDGSPAAGFTTGRPWIDVPASASAINVEAQREDPCSVYAYYRALIEARHRVPALTFGAFKRIDAGNAALFVYTRAYQDSIVLVAVNLSGREIHPSASLLDEAYSPSRWNLYLSNGCANTAADAHDPAPASSMRPWEARVYLAAR